MTRDEWEAVSYLIENCWRGGFGDEKSEAYFGFLRSYERADVERALHRLVLNPCPFVPAVSEIVAAINDTAAEPVPSWSEVFRALRLGVAHGGRSYFAPAAEKTEVGAAFVAERCHPVAGKFFEAVGYDHLAYTEFDDPEYGALREKDLRGRWDEFVGVAQERLTRDRALGAVGQREGLERLDQAALLNSVGRKPSELPETIS